MCVVSTLSHTKTSLHNSSGRTGTHANGNVTLNSTNTGSAPALLALEYTFIYANGCPARIVPACMMCIVDPPHEQLLQGGVRDVAVLQGALPLGSSQGPEQRCQLLQAPVKIRDLRQHNPP